MTRTQLALRTFAWAAVGFMVTNGALFALAQAFEVGDYATGVRALTIALIAAVLSGIIAVLQSLRFSATTPEGRALSQFVQMLVAGLVTLGIADLTGEAAVAFVGALGKLIVASAIGAVQAYFVNKPSPVEPAPVE